MNIMSVKKPRPCPLCGEEMHTVHDPFSNNVRHSCGCGMVEEPFSVFKEQVTTTGRMRPQRNGKP